MSTPASPLLLLLLLTGVTARLSGQEVDITVVQAVQVALSHRYPDHGVEVAIGRLRGETGLGVLAKIGADSAVFAADSTTQASAALQAVEVIRAALPDSLQIDAVIVYWTWSPRLGVTLQSTRHRFLLDRLRHEPCAPS